MALDMVFDLSSCTPGCPYLTSKKGTNKPVCGLSGKEISDVSKVPSWCPLKETCEKK